MRYYLVDIRMTDDPAVKLRREVHSTRDLYDSGNGNSSHHRSRHRNTHHSSDPRRNPWSDTALVWMGYYCADTRMTDDTAVKLPREVHNARDIYDSGNGNRSQHRSHHRDTHHGSDHRGDGGARDNGVPDRPRQQV